LPNQKQIVEKALIENEANGLKPAKNPILKISPLELKKRFGECQKGL